MTLKILKVRKMFIAKISLSHRDFWLTISGSDHCFTLNWGKMNKIQHFYCHGLGNVIINKYKIKSSMSINAKHFINYL